MERNSSSALRAPGAFGASGISNPHVTLSSCSLHITHVCWLPAVLRPSSGAAATRPPAAPAPPAPLPLFSACEFVAVLYHAMRVCWLAAVLRPSAAAPFATRPPAAPAPPAPLPLFSACKSVAVLGRAMRVCLLAAQGRSTSGGAASGRTGASGASQRGLRPHCGAAESGFTGRRRRLGRALYPPTEAST